MSREPLIKGFPAVIVFLVMVAADVRGENNYAEREDVKAFVKELAAEESFDERELLSLFRHAEYKQKIIDAISRPAEKTLTWAKYQDIFLTERRTKGGIEFMHQNKEALMAAYDIYGVPPVIVTAIMRAPSRINLSRIGEVLRW